MNCPMSLEGRKIIITGAGQGIGQGIAELAVSLGAQVALVDLNEKTVKDVRSTLGEDKAYAYVGNVADPDFVKKMVADAINDMGDLDGLVNNAGIVRAALIHKMTIEQWNQVLDVNLKGVFLCLQEVGKYFIQKSKQGNKSPGSIVNISSDAGRRGTFGQINYGAAKSGVLGITMSSAREWGQYGIRSNSVCYGIVITEMTKTIRTDKFIGPYLKQIPLGRMSTPEEAATPVCFLLSEAASYITGQHLSVNGGFHIGF